MRGGGAHAFMMSRNHELRDLGRDLLNWWHIPAAADSLLTLNGGNVSQLNARVGGVNVAQATGSAQPAHHSSGGPSDRPYIELQDAARFLDGSVSVSAANRAGLYVLMKAGANGDTTAWYRTSADGERLEAYRTNDAYAAGVGFTGGNQFLTDVTAPPLDTGWHLHAIRPLSAGARYEVDGVLASPNLTGSDTIGAIDGFRIGNNGVSGGSIAFAALVDDPTDDKDAIVREYVRRAFGVGAASLSALGSDLLFHWEPSEATVTLNGSNVSQLDERVAGTANATQGTAGNQPAWNASGGGAGGPYISFQDTGRNLQASPMIAAGKRIGIFTIQKIASGGASRAPCQLNTSAAGGVVHLVFNSAGVLTAGTAQDGASSTTFTMITSPNLAGVADTRILCETSYLASGLELRINGALVTPQPSGTGAARSVSTAYIGNPSQAGGEFELMIVVDNMDAAKRAIVHDYVRYWHGANV